MSVLVVEDHDDLHDAAHDGRLRAERMQATAYFQKPVDFDQLLGAVREHALD